MENNNQNNNDNGNKTPRSPQSILLIIIGIVVTFILVSTMTRLLRGTSTREVTYNEFWQKLEAGQVSSVEFDGTQINFTLKDSGPAMRVTYYTGYVADDDLVPLLKEKGIKYSRTVEDSGSTIVEFLLVYILPILLIWVFFSFMLAASWAWASPTPKSIFRRRPA